jgi:hypothetical protein
VLRGVWTRTLIPKRNNPIINEVIRRFDKILNFVGGNGMYHIIAQMARKINKFNSLPQVEYRAFNI